MSVKGETTEVEQQPTTRSGPAEHHGWAERSGSGQWIARSGRAAVNAVERRICGDAAVHSVAMAEGLALAGRRAAKLLDRSPQTPAPATEPMAAAGWVEHRLRWRADQAGRRTTFELVASNVQQAVDHALVAQHIAARLGTPVACTLDRELAEALSLVRLADPLPVPERLNHSGERAAALEIADEAFEAVSAATGRPIRAVELHRMDDAQLVLLAAGATGARATALADELRAAGVDCGAVLPALQHPDSVERLAEVLRGRDRVLVIEPGEASAYPTDLAARLQLALGTVGQPRVETVRPGDEPTEWRSAVCRALGVETPPHLPLEVAEPPVVFGVAPGGPWSDEFLLDVVTHLADLGPWRIARPSFAARGVATLSVGRALPEQVEGVEIDRLLVAAPELLRSETLAAVRGDGSVLLCGHGAPEQIWPTLPKVLRGQLAESRVRFRWIDLSQLAEHQPDEPDALRMLLHGAVLADPRLASRLDVDRERLAGLAEGQGRWFAEGTRIVRDLDISKLEQAAGLADQTFGTEIRLPRMPESAAEATDDSWRELLREFYMTGRGAHSALEPLPALPLSPVAAARLDVGGPDWRRYPLIVADDGQDESSGCCSTLLDQVREALEVLERSGESATLLAEHPGRYVAAACAALRDRPGPIPLSNLIERARTQTSREFDLSDAGAGQLEHELDLLESRLPRSGFAIGLDEQSVTTLYATALHYQREPRRAAFRAEIESLVLQLNDLLRLDDALSPEGSSPETLSATLGGTSAQLIDPEALASSLPGHRGSKRLTPARRGRIESTLESLRSYLDGGATEPEMVVVHSGPVPREWERAPVQLVEHPDGLEAAAGILAGLAQNRVDLFRAVRTARLEARHAFDETRHGRLLARLDWEAFTAEEYFLLPSVVVLESGKRLRGRGIHSLSRLLRSGLPVHVLISDHVLDLELDASWEETAGYHPGLGYVAVAHREAFVLQSTLAEPGHLFDGLTRMATTLRPAVALVAHPVWGGTVSPWRQLVAARDGRATPCFQYDPDAGDNWADRFDLSGNPEFERTWPEARTTYLDSDRNEQTWIQPFTFADAAALDPGYRSHFRVVPPQAWGADQSEIGRYLEADGDGRSMPYLWVVDASGTLARAVITRELAFACRDRMRAWHILQELAGTNNEYARRAAESARLETLDEARRTREELEATHAEELTRVRAEAASEAMERLVGVLMDVDSLPVVQKPAQAAPPPAPPELEEAAGDEVVAEPPAESPAAAEEMTFDEAFIDAPLCTTCQECINLNPKMFKYDGNKQAFISDVTAGTFEQLVQAAEKCPARCIHPGIPRADDATATDELIARGAKFN